MKARSILSLLVLAGILLVPAVSAYVLSGARWLDGTTVMNNGISRISLSGVPFESAFNEAAEAWNETPFNFQLDPEYVNPCEGYSRSDSGTGFPNGNGNGINSIDFRDDVCGNDFGDGVLAIALSFSFGNTLGFANTAESDIIFNDSFNWNVYDGPLQSRIDFRRVALHELGHVLGLGHELIEPAIMAPQISSLDALTADDIAGATVMYGEAATCPIFDAGVNSLMRNALEFGDCRIQELYSTGNDTSFVDVYKLSLSEQKTLRLRMSSNELDSVLLITTPQLSALEIYDDTNGSCNVDVETTLDAGEYLLLANTYVEPEKCAGNTGSYTLSISDSPFPLLGNTVNTVKTADLASSLFSGRSRLAQGSVQQTTFAAGESITVEGRIDVDPAHVGQAGRLFVLAVLSNGRQYMKTADGSFKLFPGLAQLEPVSSKLLDPVENLQVVQGLKGTTTGLAGLGFKVYLGYALDSAPNEIHYGDAPISFTISP